MTAPKLVLAIVVAILLAFAIIRGINAASNDGQSNAAPNYQLVPCEQHPEAVGC